MKPLLNVQIKQGASDKDNYKRLRINFPLLKEDPNLPLQAVPGISKTITFVWDNCLLNRSGSGAALDAGVLFGSARNFPPILSLDLGEDSEDTEYCQVLQLVNQQRGHLLM